MLKKFKYLLLTVLLFTFVVGITAKIKANAISGWIWSGTEEINDGVANGNEAGFGWGSVNSSDTSSGYSYNVDIPLQDGNVTGYAWSENLGWIEFDPSGSPPEPPSHSVEREGNQLTGWARFSEIASEANIGNSGGWKGWIKMTGNTQAGTSFGVNLLQVENGTDDDEDYAWSDELGWITFENIDLPAKPQLKVCFDSGDENIDLNNSADSADLGSHYTEEFLQFSCSNTNESWITKVDSSSNWKSSNNSIGVVNDSNGVVTAGSSAQKNDKIKITARHKGVEDNKTICFYDCTTCQEETFNDETCDGGCGVNCHGKRSRGEHWIED